MDPEVGIWMRLLVPDVDDGGVQARVLAKLTEGWARHFHVTLTERFIRRCSSAVFVATPQALLGAAWESWVMPCSCPVLHPLCHLPVSKYAGFFCFSYSKPFPPSLTPLFRLCHLLSAPLPYLSKCTPSYRAISSQTLLAGLHPWLAEAGIAEPWAGELLIAFASVQGPQHPECYINSCSGLRA